MNSDCKILPCGWILALLLIPVAAFCLSPSVSWACVQRVEFSFESEPADQEDDAGDDEAGAEDEGNAEQDEDEQDEDEEDEDFAQGNPWGIDQRKLEAAQRFWYRTSYKIETQKIKNICKLNEKQLLKLETAVKGAAEKEFKVWLKKFNDQMKMFGDFGQQNDKKKKKPAKELVINDADEIDQSVIQFVGGGASAFTGQIEDAWKAAEGKLWKKTVKNVLTPQQHQAYKTFCEQRKQEYLKARADAFIADMKILLGLTDEQAENYDGIVRPLLEKAPIKTGYYANYALEYQATKYNKKKMASVLNEDQMQLMKLRLAPSKMFAGMFEGGGIVQVAGEEAGFLDGVFEAVEAFGYAAKGIADGIAQLMGAEQ